MPLLPAAIGIVLNEHKTEVLLVKRKDVPVWVLPGGGIEEGEKDEDALIREIREETGFTVQVIRQSAEYTPINRLSSLTKVYLCTILSGNISTSDETLSVSFFSLRQLPFSLFKPHAIWLHEALNSSEFISRPLHEINYFALIKHFFCHPLQVIRFAWTRFLKL